MSGEAFFHVLVLLPERDQNQVVLGAALEVVEARGQVQVFLAELEHLVYQVFLAELHQIFVPSKCCPSLFPLVSVRRPRRALLDDAVALGDEDRCWGQHMRRKLLLK